MTESEQRQAVIAEALTWAGTPFHHRARVKGAGVDCAMLLVAAYQAAGLIPADYEPPSYAMQWHLHRSGEIYLQIIQDLGGRPVDAPGPGDLAIWQIGRTFSHAAIVSAWPAIIHAAAPLGRCLVDDALTTTLHLSKYPGRYYSPWRRP